MHYQIQVISKHNLRRIEHLGVQFNFYYTPEYSLNPVVADSFFPDVFHTVIYRFPNFFVPEVFKNYVIHVWNNTREDIPLSVREDLYYVDTKSKNVHINVSKMPTRDIVSDLREVISKLIGYIYADYLNFNKKTYMKEQWLQMRGHVCKNNSEIELFTEDFKVLFGMSRGTYLSSVFTDVNFDLSKFNHAKNIVGLKDLMLLWRPVNDYLKNNKYKLIIDKKLIFKSSNLGYCGFLFLEKEYKHLFTTPFDIKKIDSLGVHFFDNSMSDWLCIDSFNINN